MRCHIVSHNFPHGSLCSDCLSTSSCCCSFLPQPLTLEGPSTSTSAPKLEAATVPETDGCFGDSASKAPPTPFQSLSLESRAPAAKTPAVAPGPQAAADTAGASVLAKHRDDDDDDELLDQLLSLEKPVSAASGSQTDCSASLPLKGECWLFRKHGSGTEVRQSERISPASDCAGSSQSATG